jgi:hypothetical protein
MKQRDIKCPNCPAMFWTERAMMFHLQNVDHDKPETEWTKINIRKPILEQLKILASADNRSVSSYLEQLIDEKIQSK